MNRFPSGEEILVSYTCAAAAKETVACPKPRRVGQIHTAICEPIRPLRRHFSHQLEICEAGNELLDIIQTKGGGGVTDESFTHIASSPPFFSGSPPSRVSNPLIHDIRFGDERIAPICPRAIPTEIPAYSKSSTARKASGSCVWANFGNNPAVRVEGFDCLDRDSRNCSISTLA